MSTDKKIDLLLRIGVAFAFLYPPISALFNPFAWIGYLPSFMLDIAGGYDIALLHIFGGFEILIGLWVLFGRNIFIPSIVATVSLLLIVLFNTTQMDVLFRDLSIALMSFSLVIKYKK